MISRREFAAAIAAIAIAQAPLPAAAQDAAFPSRPVKIIASSSAGGTLDVVARALGDQLAQLWKQPVVVEPRTGGSGMVAQRALMGTKPDGYTLLLTSSGSISSLYVQHGAEFAPDNAFTPVAFVSEFPFFVITYKTAPYRDMKEFVQYARSHPVSFGSAGIGLSTHIIGENIRRLTGAQMQHVPYPGDAPQLIDAQAGRLDIGITAPTSLPFIRSGDVRALAVTSSQRSSFTPDVPTLKEQGLDFATTGWTVLVAPKGTPPALAEKLNRDLSTVLALPSIQQLLATATSSVTRPMSIAELSRFVPEEVRRSYENVKRIGLEVK